MSSESKAGKDAAELAGLDNPTGIIATNDLDAILNDKPECAVYTAMADNRLPDELVKPIEEATTTGQSSVFVNGIDPGFGKPLDDLPILLQPGVLSLAWGSEVRQLAAAGPGRRLVPG